MVVSWIQNALETRGKYFDLGHLSESVKREVSAHFVEKLDHAVQSLCAHE